MALALAGIGEKRTITDVHGRGEITRHLQDMGFTAGSQVEVLGENAAGMILLVKGTRIALNRSLANKIMVA